MIPPLSPMLPGGAVPPPPGSSSNQMLATLRQGTETLSLRETVHFTLYVRMVLPIDGFVFWVRADMLTPAARPSGLPELEFSQLGSLHRLSSATQAEDDGGTVHRIVFTSENEVRDLAAITPDAIYIADVKGLRFSFSRRGQFYQAADLYHYEGDVVYATMASQIIDDPAKIDLTNVVVSNSLPLWLHLRAPTPVPGFGGLSIPFFPSFAVPQNCPLPYVAVHVDPSSVFAEQMAPVTDSTLSRWQLCRERVRLTTYGLRNSDVIDLVDYVVNYAATFPIFGVNNSPIVRDEKRTQVELGTLAMKKTIDFEVNYYQESCRRVARQLILTAVVTQTVV